MLDKFGTHLIEMITENGITTNYKMGCEDTSKCLSDRRYVNLAKSKAKFFKLEKLSVWTLLNRLVSSAVPVILVSPHRKGVQRMILKLAENRRYLYVVI